MDIQKVIDIEKEFCKEAKQAPSKVKEFATERIDALLEREKEFVSEAEELYAKWKECLESTKASLKVLLKSDFSEEEKKELEGKVTELIDECLKTNSRIIAWHREFNKTTVEHVNLRTYLNQQQEDES